MRSGETDKAIAIYSKKLEKLSKKISTSFKHVGNLDCDAIETKNGSIFFLDFNPVFGGGYPFTHLSGFNFIKAIINLRKNKKVHLPKKPKIKTKAFMRESFNYIKNKAKWQAAKAYCVNNNMEFKLITEKQLGLKY